MIITAKNFKAIWIYGDDDMKRNALCKKLTNELKYNCVTFVYHNYEYLKKHFTTCADKETSIASYLSAFIDSGVNSHIVINAKISNENIFDTYNNINFVEVNEYDDIEEKAYNIVDNILI